MATRNKDRGRRRNTSKVVFTGKRVKGTWIMETLIPFKAKSTGNSPTVAATENRRVRTLH
ncbi:MAG: hypothetical protein ACE5D3_02200 [Candidatus Binatia bacterium]